VAALIGTIWHCTKKGIDYNNYNNYEDYRLYCIVLYSTIAAI
jgi:hypothetical protein